MATLIEEDVAIPSDRGAETPKVRDRAVLTQTAGLEAGRICSLEGTNVTLGRSSECTHMFDDAALSRVHAKIMRAGNRYSVEDAGSRNGVFVNERRVTISELRDGDRVRLGSAITLRFQMVDAKEEAALTKVYESSVRDGLTGAFNRKYLDDRLLAEVAFAVRHQSALSVVMLDIDHFKKVNDSYGHQAGDDVLKETAHLLRLTLRTEDILGRYGGEEFIIVARGVELRKAVLLAERVRALIEQKPVTFEGNVIARTISAGVASLECCRAKRDRETLIGIADERLYKAKEGGRNWVVGE
jgi:diguanylate cyclase (GGDEF)-like protein